MATKRTESPAPSAAKSLPDGIPVTLAAFPRDWPLQVSGEPLTHIRCEGKPTDTSGVEAAWLIAPGTVLAVRYRGEVYVRSGGFTARTGS